MVKHTDTPTNQTHTNSRIRPMCSSPPAWNLAELSRQAPDGTGSLLLSFIEQYLFYSFCSADALLHVPSPTALSWNNPILPPSRASNRNIFKKKKKRKERGWKIATFICFVITLHNHLKAASHIYTPLLSLSHSLHRHPEVSWGVPGRGRSRRGVGIPRGRCRRSGQWLLVGAAHRQCPWGSGGRVLL